MKILSYNVRGLGSKAKWRCLKDVVIKEQVEVLLLQETKLQEINYKILV